MGVPSKPSGRGLILTWFFWSWSKIRSCRYVHLKRKNGRHYPSLVKDVRIQQRKADVGRGWEGSIQRDSHSLAIIAIFLFSLDLFHDGLVGKMYRRNVPMSRRGIYYLRSFTRNTNADGESVVGGQ